MTQPILEAAAFLDSEEGRSLPIDRADAREVLVRFLSCVYEDAGIKPRLLDGDDLRALLADLLPARFGRRDPLADHVGVVADAYLEFLIGREVVPHAFELRIALAEGLPPFREAVESGHLAHQRTPAQTTVVHRAAKVGRNDPCPCGSGQKFKRCCARLGG